MTLKFKVSSECEFKIFHSESFLPQIKNQDINNVENLLWIITNEATQWVSESRFNFCQLWTEIWTLMLEGDFLFLCWLQIQNAQTWPLLAWLHGASWNLISSPLSCAWGWKHDKCNWQVCGHDAVWCFQITSSPAAAQTWVLIIWSKHLSVATSACKRRVLPLSVNPVGGH